MSTRRSRMSLGPGSATPPPLGDGSARANRRTSFGGNGSGDESRTPMKKQDRRAMLDEWRRNRAGTGSGDQHPPSSAPSPGRGAAALSAPSPSRGRKPPSSAPSPGRVSSLAGPSPSRVTRSQSRRQKEHHHSEPTIEIPLPPQPPSPAPSSMDFESEESGLSALDRYRLRKKRQSLGGAGVTLPPTPRSGANAEHRSVGTPTRGRKPPPLPPSHSSSSYAEEEETTTIGHASYNLGTPRGTPSRRGKSRGSSAFSLGGAQRRVRRRTSLAPSELPPQQPSEQAPRKAKPLLPPSYPTSNERSHDKSEAEEPHQQHPPPSSEREVVIEQQQPSQPPAFSQESIESVDSVAMKSRIQAMQKRIESLEREKMELSMSKAPLEARIRQKEDAWVKERERLCHEIETHQMSSKEVDERCRELEMNNQVLEEENSRLRLEARAATSNAASHGMAGGGSGAKDSWSERLNSNKEIQGLRKEIKNKDDEIKSLRIEKVSLESEVFGCQQEIETLERNYDELEKDYQELDSSKSQNSEAEIQLQVLTTEHTAMTAQLNATCADLEEIKTRDKADLQAKEDEWKNRESELLFEMSVLKSRAGKAANEDVTMDAGEGEEDPAILMARIEERDRRISELEEQLVSGEQLRRALHNRIQELRGNIRVYVRTRPFLPNDGAARNSSIDILPDGESLTIQGKHGGEGHGFKFDKVFAPSTGQDLVFDEVSEFVQSALDGYHVCLFSYGQTGSGKTHTMQGSGNGAMRGIIPRAVEQILSQAAMMQSQRWTFTIKASFLEIYNEELKDLLVMMNPDGSMKPRDARTATKLSIKRNTEGKSFVDGINMVDIDVEDKMNGLTQLEAVIAAAARTRSVATTKMNAQSSRSHSVFMLHLCGYNKESGTVVQGALNLCDLAGSERLDRSGVASDSRRLKETLAINKSLSCLGDVFTSLANGSKHIPFRNSKLTYLLQDCLSGDGKALMFVNLSPTVESSNESLCSLRFAQRVNQVELGKATKHVQYTKGGGSRR
mmetsp:Transcript_24932/g.52202  ORF Transcript_24932/g.52202 Transcript_24932/m.52202 type:complete len:1014 (-) Transcript_24932:390-3431(-)